MDDLIKLVKTYRLTAGIADRLRLAEDIIRLIVPDLRVFVFSKISDSTGEDALQEVLKAVVTGMRSFRGGTEKEFWAWSYRIARNKLNDHYRSKKADRMQPMAPADLWKAGKYER
jgi:DNA-directed RNA polymerase specialized sigma24 family protein